MAYSLNAIYDNFQNEICELNRLVFSLSSAPESIDRDTHIEGCFIRMVVSWEYFVEEYFLRCMCDSQTRSKKTIKPRGIAIKNTDIAFTKINKNRKNRDQDYADWLDIKIVQQRIDDYFRKNSRVQSICESPDRMYELRIIRNAIAHKSTSAVYKFKKYVKNQLGYLAELNPSMASLLIQRKRDSNEIIFTLLSNYFLDLADRLTK